MIPERVGLIGTFCKVVAFFADVADLVICRAVISKVRV